jgi:hypothetical protein
LVLRIEDDTGIEISESDATRIENVGDLLHGIEFAIKNQNGTHRLNLSSSSAA